jgi:hypothetical protein
MNTTANNPLSTPDLDALLLNPQQSADPELASLAATLRDLRESSLAAADFHQRHAIVTPHHRIPRAAWVFATAALALCTAAPFAFHRTPAPTPIAVVATPQPTPAISDENLFADIQNDLNANVPDPMLPLTATSTSTQSTTQRKRK